MDNDTEYIELVDLDDKKKKEVQNEEVQDETNNKVPSYLFNVSFCLFVLVCIFLLIFFIVRRLRDDTDVTTENPCFVNGLSDKSCTPRYLYEFCLSDLTDTDIKVNCCKQCEATSQTIKPSNQTNCEFANVCFSIQKQYEQYIPPTCNNSNFDGFTACGNLNPCYGTIYVEECTDADKIEWCMGDGFGDQECYDFCNELDTPDDINHYSCQFSTMCSVIKLPDAESKFKLCKVPPPNEKCVTNYNECKDTWDDCVVDWDRGECTADHFNEYCIEYGNNYKVYSSCTQYCEFFNPPEDDSCDYAPYCSTHFSFGQNWSNCYSNCELNIYKCSDKDRADYCENKDVKCYEYCENVDISRDFQKCKDKDMCLSLTGDDRYAHLFDYCIPYACDAQEELKNPTCTTSNRNQYCKDAQLDPNSDMYTACYDFCANPIDNTKCETYVYCQNFENAKVPDCTVCTFSNMETCTSAQYDQLCLFVDLDDDNYELCREKCAQYDDLCLGQPENIPLFCTQFNNKATCNPCSATNPLSDCFENPDAWMTYCNIDGIDCEEKWCNNEDDCKNIPYCKGTLSCNACVIEPDKFANERCKQDPLQWEQYCGDIDINCALDCSSLSNSEKCAHPACYDYSNPCDGCATNLGDPNTCYDPVAYCSIDYENREICDKQCVNTSLLCMNTDNVDHNDKLLSACDKFFTPLTCVQPSCSSGSTNCDILDTGVFKNTVSMNLSSASNNFFNITISDLKTNVNNSVQFLRKDYEPTLDYPAVKGTEFLIHIQPNSGDDYSKNVILQLYQFPTHCLKYNYETPNKGKPSISYLTTAWNDTEVWNNNDYVFELVSTETIAGGFNKALRKKTENGYLYFRYNGGTNYTFEPYHASRMLQFGINFARYTELPEGFPIHLYPTYPAWVNTMYKTSIPNVDFEMDVADLIGNGYGALSIQPCYKGSYNPRIYFKDVWGDKTVRIGKEDTPNSNKKNVCFTLYNPTMLISNSSFIFRTSFLTAEDTRYLDAEKGTINDIDNKIEFKNKESELDNNLYYLCFSTLNNLKFSDDVYTTDSTDGRADFRIYGLGTNTNKGAGLNRAVFEAIGELCAQDDITETTGFSKWNDWKQDNSIYFYSLKNNEPITDNFMYIFLYDKSITNCV
jgi:hypothetical protein